MSWKPEVDEINQRRELALKQGGDVGIARQHEKGRLTIRERIDELVDAGSFDEIGKGAGAAERGNDGELIDFTPANFVLGFAEIEGRRVIVGGEDFTLKGGSPSPAGLRKSVYTEDLALQYKLPLVRLHEGAGGSVGGSGGPSMPGPVFQPSRFKSVAQTLGA
ncbi:MAG: carboxyl transferase domain-containing protein, partial [Pseudomonadota bacterium]